MQLAAGDTLGVYRIAGLIGAGGMGEVYRARDTRLDRDVALKLLPEEFAKSAERLARFQREARTLASLNHPHIAQIYGLEEQPGRVALAMEFVEGEDLAQRLERGPLSLDDIFPIARQVGDALESAHAQGIIHRDLKPANIKVRPDGTVKVLDFGLAKAVDQSSGVGLGSSGGMSMSPTMTSPAMTAAGVILGTAAYMSPEQARGKPVDKRADIWAFGCLLFEMLTGRRAFEGDDVASTIGASIHKEPAWAALPASTPPALRATIERCLQKDPRQRFHDMGDVRLSLDGMFSVPAPVVTTLPGRSRSSVVAVATIAAVVSAAVAGLAVWTLKRPTPIVRTPLRFQVPTPDGKPLLNFFSLSPNGSTMAMTLRGGEKISLWIQSLETGDIRELTRANAGNTSQVWSPDSRSIVYMGSAGIMRSDLAGGAPEVLVPGLVNWTGGAWLPDDTILFGRQTGGLMRVPAKGGAPVEVTELDADRHEAAHGNPWMLPDGRHFIYSRTSSVADNSGIFVGSIDAPPSGQSRTRLVASSQQAEYAPSLDGSPGHVLFVRNGALMAQPLDERTLQLSGDPVQLVENIGIGPSTYAHFWLSNTNTLAYRVTDAGLGGVPTWFDHNGRELGPVGNTPIVHASHPRISPDGKRLALIVNTDLWVYDLGGRPPIRLTFLEANRATTYSPLWTPDGQSIVYEPSGSGLQGLKMLAADGSNTTPTSATPPGHFHPHGWSLDGKELLTAFAGGPATGWDIVRVPLGAEGKPSPVVVTPKNEGFLGAALSPNKRFLAYASDLTGSYEIWVRPYPGPGAPERISPNGGMEPTWAQGGRELIYLENNRFMSVKTSTDGTFSFSSPTLLFETPVARVTQPPSYDVAADGRLLVMKAPPTREEPINVVVNWDQTVKK
jgi:serine/threonine protein kinase/Tol biopolymer transport system component